MGIPSGSEWIIVLLVVVLVFGASRLPLLGKNLGQGIKEFKKGVKEAGRKDDDAPAAHSIDPTPSSNGVAPVDQDDIVAKRRD